MENVYWNILSDLIVLLLSALAFHALPPIGIVWVRLWAWWYLAAADALIAAYHEEVFGAHWPDRLRRAPVFLAKVPAFARAQAQAEINPKTETKTPSLHPITGHGELSLGPVSLSSSGTIHASTAQATAAAHATMGSEEPTE
jgi:hypothetical protein